MSSYDDWIKFLAGTDSKLEVTDGDAEHASVVICRLAPRGDPLIFPDNLLAHCSKCFRMVQFRPHAPRTPPKLCDECGPKEIAKHKDSQFLITENTARDLAEFIARKKRH